MMANLRKKSQITLREKSHWEFAIAVSRKTDSSTMLNKIAIVLTKQAIIGSITSIARGDPQAIK